MKDEIIKLSNECNSLEISRVLKLPLSIVEEVLVDEYFKDNWKISKENLLEAALRIYIESPTILSEEIGISEVTLKKYLNACKLFNNKKTSILVEKSDRELNQLLPNLIEDYNVNQLAITQLMVKYKLSKNKVKELLHSNEISTDKVTCDEHVFDVIDTEEKAYWLGFLYADGAIGSSNNNIELSLKLLDCKHLYKFKSFLKAKRNVRIETDKIKRCRFTVTSEHLKSRLIELGCTPRKSLTLKFPTEEQVPTQFIIPFIRGYFDGDGVLSFAKSWDHIVPSTGMLGTEDFLNGVIAVFKYSIHDTLHKANKEGAEECKIVSWAKSDSELFLTTIYKDATIYLDRKYKRYQFFKENNFAVQKSNFLDNDQAISEESKQWINYYFNINIDDLLQDNSEISTEIKESVLS